MNEFRFGPRLASHASWPQQPARGPRADVNRLESTADHALTEAVGRHDQDALAELYRRYGGSVFTLALRVLTVRGLAEEVVQDVFIRLWQSPDRFDPARGSLRSFLLAQAHHRAIDTIRAETARRRREERDSDAVRPVYVLEDEAIDSTVGDELHRVVETLSAPERQAIGLAYFGGHTYAEVAELLGIPAGTAKSRIRSGLRRLRAALLEAGIDPFMANTALR